MKQIFRLPALLAWGLWLCFGPNAKAQVCDNLVLDFDGNGDYISCASLPATFSNNSNFTVEAWFYANNPGTACIGDFRPLVSLFDPATSHVFEIAICNGGQLHYYFFNGGALPFAIPLSGTDYSGACHHLAVTRASNQFAVYVDGTLIYTGNLGTNPFNFNNFNVGGGTSFIVGPDWEGQIDEIRLWSTVRSAQQIKDFKDCSLSGISAGLELNWPLDFDGAVPYGNNVAITQTLDAATASTTENGILNGFNLGFGSLNSNYVCNACPIRYQLDISDQVSLFPVLLSQICEGDKAHFCVTDNGNAVSVPVGSMVMWESSDGGLPFAPDLDMANYALSTNATCFPVKKGVITNPDCGNIGQGFVDRKYRAKILKKMGSEVCTYTTTEHQLRICCPPTCGNITIVPSLQPPWCEGDNVSMSVFLNPCDPWLPFGPNVTIDWCMIDENGTTPLPQFQNQLSFTGFLIIVGTQDICLQAKITNCSCPGIVVEKCFSVDPMPMCGTIDVVTNTPTPISPIPPTGAPYKYEICPGDYTILEMQNPVTDFKNCTPVWQYHFGPPVPAPTSPNWVDLGSSNSTQNTNTLPQLNPLAPALWPSWATCIYYRIQCRPESWPNSGCDPCYSNLVEICLKPAPPSGVISGVQQYCQGSGAGTLLTITPNQPGSWTYCWYWNGVLESTSTSPTFFATKPGNYWVEIKDGCQSTKVGPYLVEECTLLPKIDCSIVNPCACDGNPILLSGCNSMYTCANTGPLPLVYTWTTSNNGPCVPGPNGPCECEHTPDPVNGTTYTLTIYDPNLNCSATSKPLFIKPCQ